MKDSLRILLVDHDADFQSNTMRLLEKHGYAVERACSGAEALNAIREHRPEMVLLNRDIQDVNGDEICRSIKQDKTIADTFLVLVAASNAENNELPLGPESGADGCIFRPIGNRELLAHLDSYARIISLTKSLKQQSEELKSNKSAANHSQFTSLSRTDAAGDQLQSANLDSRYEIDWRIQAEERIKWLASFPELDTNPVIEVNLDAHALTYANPAAIRLFPDLPSMGLEHPFLAGLLEHSAEFVINGGTSHREVAIGRFIYSQFLAAIKGTTCVRLYCEDITERKRTELRVLQMNRVYSVLSDINQTIVREKDVQNLFATACRIAVEKGKFRMAWVGMLDEKEQIVRPIASAGFVDGYLDTINIDLKDAARLIGPVATCMSTNEHQICADISSDPRIAPWRDNALVHGYRSMASFPLNVEAKTLGVFSLYSDQPHFFDADELELLDELAKDISFALEVSQREEQRKRLHESHDRLATAVEQAAETIVITDTRGTIIYANPAFEKSSGYTRAEAIGQNPRILNSGKQGTDFYREMWTTLRRGEVWHGHFCNKRKDGSLFQEDATISPIRDASGQVVNFVAVKRDVTHEGELEAQFRQSQKMEAFGLLAGGVAHDFNNLMSVVIGYSDIWLMKVPADAPIRGPLKAIRNAGERATDLTKQLLAFSRKTVLEPKILDINTVVRETEKMLKRLIGEDIQFTSILNPAIPRIRVDPGQMGQVLINLAVNARDAMPRGGKLTIQTSVADLANAPASLQQPGSEPERQVLLTVTDTGVGMPPEVLSRIFEPFFTTKGVGKGTGLGLAVVHGVVTQSGGKIQVESTVGVGTTFKLYFPATLELPRPAPKSGEHVVHSGIETVLVVEDEDCLREIVKESLRSFGYTVLTANSGLEALKLAINNRSKFDLLLTDVVMPGMSGRELADKIKFSLPEVKIIFMSGHTDDSVVRHGVIHEQVAFLQKPFTPFELLKKVREELDRP